MKIKNVRPVLLIAIFSVAIFWSISGYVKNIYLLTKCDFAPISKCEILRGIGIVVPPIGTAFGYIEIKE